MAFKPIVTTTSTTTGSSKKFADFRPWKQWAKGDFLIGTYKGPAAKLDKFKKPVYQVEVIESSFDAQKGQIFSMNATGGLTLQMNQVEEGEMIKVTYKGMAVTTSGDYQGDPCHAIEVQIDSKEDDLL